MKRGEGLKRKTPLKANKALSASKEKKMKKRVPLEQKTAQQLLKEADKWFSWYVRLRDGEYDPSEMKWYSPCITHDQVYVVRWYDHEKNKWRWTGNTNAGHYISRDYHILRFDEENVNHQCVHCNKWKGGEIEKYKTSLNDKYGEGTYQKLDAIAMEDRKKFRWTRKLELLEMIADYKELVAFLTKVENA